MSNQTFAVVFAGLGLFACLAAIPAAILLHRDASHTWNSVIRAGVRNGRRVVALAALRSSRARLLTTLLLAAQLVVLLAVVGARDTSAPLPGSVVLFVSLLAATNTVICADGWYASRDRRAILAQERERAREEAE